MRRSVFTRPGQGLPILAFVLILPLVPVVTRPIDWASAAPKVVQEARHVSPVAKPSCPGSSRPPSTVIVNPPVTVPVTSPVRLSVTPAEMTDWSRVCVCEENGNWYVRGPYFSGGLGISDVNWIAYGGTQFAPSAADATPAEQIIIAQRIRSDPPDQNGCTGDW